MNSNRKTELEEEIEYLKKLIQTHIDYKSIIWEGREAEFEEHLNAMLDYFNELREELENINTKKDNDDRNS